ncbi:MAG: hypothetical protein HC882_02410 [Acidobacteria bacterium]|nr:hypothetical protein [Acidobacteriota bacterium]
MTGELALNDRLDRIETLLLALNERIQETMVTQAAKSTLVEIMAVRLERLETRQAALEERERRALFVAVAALLGVLIYAVTGQVVLPSLGG